MKHETLWRCVECGAWVTADHEQQGWHWHGRLGWSVSCRGALQEWRARRVLDMRL